MFAECRHVLPSGQKCKSPIVQHSIFCYFHRNVRERAELPPPRQGTPFLLPFIEDSRGVLLAVNEVFRAMGQGRIKRNEASTYLSGIQLAAKVIARTEDRVWEPVRALEYDRDGTEQAPAKTACEPLQDCLNCDRQDICEACEAAKELKPVVYKNLVARARCMTDGQALYSWEVRQKASDERMRRLRSLAVVDNYEEPIYKPHFPPQPPQPQSESANETRSDQTPSAL
jgi:hypothetical protein